ncbi:ROK family protein [Paratissierella segnis]|jgi:glucokinase|uniref:ROK family protein n=1 Tax=Paratissierella segnis TaxID=2763679 RepID=A0A926ES40_9FIRM|nr:ROK family protein [Paratissierella segnis]MBC8588738.1 ROK family protein [Paratissierella segnis]
MENTIGIDLGGTSIKGGVVNAHGEIIRKAERDTGKKVGKKEVLNRIKLVIKDLLGDDIIGIGLGSPGFIDSNEGKVLDIGGNIEDWAHTDIKGELSKEFPNLPIFVENDANVAGICEGWIGAGKGFRSFAMLTLGTGVGGCIYTEKEGIWNGNNFQGAELGHTILYPNGRECNCGQKGCVERYISGAAVERIYEEMTGKFKKGKYIFKDSLTNDVDRELVDKFTQDLAIYIVSLKNIFDPEGIIIGGGVINSREYWWEKMIKYYKEYINDDKGLKIVPAIYQNDAGIIGAAKIVFNHIK